KGLHLPEDDGILLKLSRFEEIGFPTRLRSAIKVNRAIHAVAADSVTRPRDVVGTDIERTAIDLVTLQVLVVSAAGQHTTAIAVRARDQNGRRGSRADTGYGRPIKTVRGTCLNVDRQPSACGR